MKSSLLLFLSSAVVPLWAAPAPTEASRRAGDVVPGRFIVQLTPGASSETVKAHHHQVRRMLRRKRAEDGGNGPAGVRRVFSFGDFYSYSAGLDELTAADIAQLPDVLTVEPDIVVRLEPSDPEAAPASAHSGRALKTQHGAGWFLGDISHKKRGVDEYVYDEKAGEGTTIYVLDSGIRASHVDFEDRVRFGINGATNSTTPSPLNKDRDSSGHGTHVASTAAGQKWGVAKKAKVVDCKTLDSAGEGSIETLLTSLAWAVRDILDRKAEKTSVLNMSLGIHVRPSFPPMGTVLENAIIKAHKKGVLTVTAAGNEGEPAAWTSPARLKEVITVGMTDLQRCRPEPSNYGPELDIFAPGILITAAGFMSDKGVEVQMGTSMATAIVSGVVSYLRSIESGLNTPEEVRARLIELSSKDVVQNAAGSPNRLLYNGSGR